MWWKAALLIVAAIVVLVVIVGVLLPKSHTATRRVAYAQPAERVWDVIHDFEKHPEWRETVAQVRRLDDRNGHAVWEERSKRGDRLAMEVIESVPPKRMVTKIVDNKSFGGTWTWDVEALPTGGSALTITEDGEVHNPVFRFIGHFFMDPRATMDGVHRALGAKFGEDVVLGES
jgi:uncharacterized protein YndB with AHSA1/START domain